jgi:hypothetical protein
VSISYFYLLISVYIFLVFIPSGDQSTFDFFRQETSHTDVLVRTEAMANVVLVCALMTPDKVRGDLVPYLQCKFSIFNLGSQSVNDFVCRSQTE